ncbi:MAG: 50S ribosomal protein L29 [Myxococcales bacterium]|nr:50S ribosomal protein L29 [Myxococcales bacterium]
MKVEEIRQRTDEELTTLARQLAEDLYTLRVQRATNQLENTSSLRIKRRDLAKVKTVLRARLIGTEQNASE